MIEHQYLRKRFSLETDEPKVVDRVDLTKIPTHAIQGTPWYDILSNQTYAEEFCYFGPYVKDRESYIKNESAELKEE